MIEKTPTKDLPKRNRLGVALRNLFTRRCLRDDEGAVLLYTVVISFFLLAVFSLIFDVARVSETKMRMQDAADAAALQFATIQARGMNTVQNINNDIYDTDTTAITLYGLGTGLAHGAQAAYVSGLASWVGAVLDGLGIASIGTASYLRNCVVSLGLKPLRMVHVYGTTPMAYLAANEAARLNEADNLVGTTNNQADASLNSGGSFLGDLFNDFLEKLSLDGIYVVQIPTSFDSALMLPLEVKKSTSLPLNTSLADAAAEFADIDDIDSIPGYEHFSKYADLIGLMKMTMHKAPLSFTHKFANLHFGSVAVMEGWQDDSFVSKSPYNEEEKTYLPPAIMVTAKKSGIGLFSSALLGGDDPPPVMAYAVAQCQGGNVVTYRGGDSSQGVGADAVLVPFSTIAKHHQLRDDENNNQGNHLWNALDDLGIFLH